VPDPAPDGCLGLRVGSLWRRIDREFDRAFRAYELSHAHAQLLLRLLEEGPLRVHELAKRTGFESSTVSRLLKRLVDGQFVLVRPDAEDRRMRLVRPAARARHLAQALVDARDRINRRLQRDLATSDLATFWRVLEALGSRHP